MRARNRLRGAVRDLVVQGLALPPTPAKVWLFRHLHRVILGLLFRLEREGTVVAPAGPSNCRYRMRLSWQEHTAYVMGTYEPEVVEALRKHLRPGNHCIDVGAHLGYTTILMARLVGPRGRVVAFEPLPENFRVLEGNVRMNRLDNVRVEQAAVSDAAQSALLYFPAAQRLSSTPSFTGYAVQGKGRTIRVPTVNLDSYLDTRESPPDLIKIDVEGAELAVLRGARHTLATARPILLVEVHGWGAPPTDEVLRLLSEFGYGVSILGVRNREAHCLAVPGAGWRSNLRI